MSFRFIKETVLYGLAYGILMGLFLSLRTINPFAVGPSGMAYGLVAGLIFGLMFATFLARQRSGSLRKIPSLQGEFLLKDGPANHFCGLEGVGGWLYLTDKRLLFQSHRFNIQNHELSIPLDEIVEAKACQMIWVLPTGLRVTTTKKAERFVVEGHESWVAEISRIKERHAERTLEQGNPTGQPD